MKNISIFCGSSKGVNPIYEQEARKLATEMASRKMTMVYGGGKVGIMGVLADEMIRRDANTIGVIPEFIMDMEVAETRLKELIVVDSMHARKKKIEELSDAFIALPGGFGTLDEIFEISTWAQLKIHSKPCAFLNVNGYFNHLFRFMDHMVSEGFIAQAYLDMIIKDDDPVKLIDQLSAYVPPQVDKAHIALSNSGMQKL